jgi:hypothetical protein
MADDQDRLQARRARSAISHHQIAFAVIRAQNFDVFGRKSGSEQPLGHRVGCYRRAAYRIRRIDFDELLENIMRQFTGRFIERRGGQSAQD